MLHFQQYSIIFMLNWATFWVYAPQCCYRVPYYPRLNKQSWDQGSTTFSPSHIYMKVVSNTSRDTIFCSTNNTASLHVEFSYFLSLFSQILFLGTILSKAQYITMVPGFHLILTSLWVEKRFCNTSWGLIYCPNNGTTLFCAVVCYFLRQRSKT